MCSTACDQGLQSAVFMSVPEDSSHLRLHLEKAAVCLGVLRGGDAAAAPHRRSTPACRGTTSKA